MYSEKGQKEEISVNNNENCETLDGYTVPPAYLKVYKEINDLEVFDDDIWVTSFPKCGTTWTQEMVWCITNNLNYEAAKTNLDLRFPFLEYCVIYSGKDPDNRVPHVIDSINTVRNLKRPRYIKTHLPWQLLPKQIRNFEKRPKIIQVFRNPKDVCISFYHHSKIFNGFKGDLQEFSNYFMNGGLYIEPVIQSMLGYWANHNEPNLLFIKYEDMHKNLPQEIRRVATFFGKTISAEEVRKLAEHLDFNSMKENNAVNHSQMTNFLKETDHCVKKDGVFMRKGIAGSYKLEMKPDLISKFDMWIENELKNTGLSL